MEKVFIYRQLSALQEMLALNSFILKILKPGTKILLAAPRITQNIEKMYLSGIFGGLSGYRKL
ncbi:MAG: hypothetical protein ACI4WM_09480 [Erysipelotrichaceae bacterium]